MTKKFTSPLTGLKIAAPCTVDWNSMTGNDRVRFCGQCQLNVYNLSEMSQQQAEDLLRRTEGRLCVRFYQRADGTILTNNCPVGLRALKKKISMVAGAVISAVISFCAGMGFYSFSSKPSFSLNHNNPINRPLMGDVAMGKMAIKTEPAPMPLMGTPVPPTTNGPVATPLMGKPAIDNSALGAKCQLTKGSRSLPIMGRIAVQPTNSTPAPIEPTK